MEAIDHITLHLADGTMRRFVPDVVAPPPPVYGPLTNQSRLGVNLDFCDSSSTCHAFADALKSARPLGVHAAPDSRIVFVEQVAADGAYTLYRDDGPASTRIVPPGQSALTLVNLGLSKYELIRPGCSHGDLFTPQFLQNLAPFGCLRDMDWGGTNGSKVFSWSDRPTLESPTWERLGYGVPLEVRIALINQTGKDWWTCLPHGCSDDYVEKFRDLVLDTLRGDVDVLVELGNESTWNTKTPFDVGRNHALGMVRPFSPQAGTWASSIYHEPDGKFNESNAVHYWWALRTVEIAKILGPRFRCVLSNQHTYGKKASEYGWWFKKQLDFLRRQGITPRTWIKVLASAPYGGLGDANPYEKQRKAISAIARAEGMEYRYYEFGGHNTKGGQAMVDRHLSPEAGIWAEQYLNTTLADSDGGCWFVNASNHRVLPNQADVVNTFGLTPGTHTTYTPKYQAAAKVAGERIR